MPSSPSLPLSAPQGQSPSRRSASAPLSAPQGQSPSRRSASAPLSAPQGRSPRRRSASPLLRTPRGRSPRRRQAEHPGLGVSEKEAHACLAAKPPLGEGPRDGEAGVGRGMGASPACGRGMGASPSKRNQRLPPALRAGGGLFLSAARRAADKKRPELLRPMSSGGQRPWERGKIRSNGISDFPESYQPTEWVSTRRKHDTRRIFTTLCPLIYPPGEDFRPLFGQIGPVGESLR